MSIFHSCFLSPLVMTYLKISNEKLIEIIGIKATNYKSGTEGNFQMQDLGETFTSSSSPRMSPLQVSIPSSMAAAAASMMRPEVSLLSRGWRSPSQKTPLWLIQGPLGGSPASRGPLEVPCCLSWNLSLLLGTTFPSFTSFSASEKVTLSLPLHTNIKRLSELISFI